MGAISVSFSRYAYPNPIRKTREPAATPARGATAGLSEVAQARVNPIRRHGVAGGKATGRWGTE
ncbi:hypothetical protein [Actinoplanes sp. NPDC049802]|uniref:hypothetical protein n=1 Tax=Actinoplanes sp. NPDC049802 TaxID=3154742 RepID=UPI0033EB8308